jgi:hypothetical protein
MTPQDASDTSPASSVEQLREESARYALMRRIAPALRHHMAGTLQPIGMIAAIMERRLQAAEPDLAVLRENAKSVGTLSRSAASASMNLMTWVAPKDNGVMALQAGVEECAGMLATDLAFRGFTVVNTIDAPEMMTSVFALRNVFTASLIALTDAARAPAQVTFSSVTENGHARVSIAVTSEEGAAFSEDPRPYRKLGWDDVQALASAEKVTLNHAAGRVEMLFSEAHQADVLA